MRIMLFYDLEMDDKKKVKEYNIFRNEIICRGFIMMQFSIYYKIIAAPQYFNNEITQIKKILPNKGDIRVLLLTEKQFSSMKLLNGKIARREKINNADRHLII